MSEEEVIPTAMGRLRQRTQVIALQMAVVRRAVPAVLAGDMDSDSGVTSLGALMILQAAAGVN